MYIEETETTSQYHQAVATVVLLTASREKELATIIQSHKANMKVKAVNQAAEELATANLRLVLKVANNYCNKIPSLNKQDVIAAGEEGLMKAIYKFSAKRNTKFSTYAIYWIRQSILRFIKASLGVKVPSYILDGLTQMRRLIAEHADIGDDELCTHLGVNKKQLENIKKAQMSYVEMDAPAGSDSGEDSTGDLMSDESAETPFQIVERAEQYEVLNKVLAELTPIKRDIIMSQCMSTDKIKLQTLGKKYNMSGERIRQIKEAALEELRHKMKKLMGA